MENVVFLKLLRQKKTLYQSMWIHVVLFADRSSKDEQLSIRPLLRKLKTTSAVGCEN
jgi:hypothetical protein